MLSCPNIAVRPASVPSLPSRRDSWTSPGFDWLSPTCLLRVCVRVYRRRRWLFKWSQLIFFSVCRRILSFLFVFFCCSSIACNVNHVIFALGTRHTETDTHNNRWWFFFAVQIFFALTTNNKYMKPRNRRCDSFGNDREMNKTKLKDVIERMQRPRQQCTHKIRNYNPNGFTMEKYLSAKFVCPISMRNEL